MEFKNKNLDSINVLLITVIWIIMVILVNPIGDFPLKDDWAYGKAVLSVLEKGEFQLSGWTATNLVSQVYWGALFCWPFGFSFTALRLSTLSLGLTGILCTYGLLRTIDANPYYSLLGALIIAANPIYFLLSNTFMNDIPFFAFATLSLLFLFRGLKHDSLIQILIGLFFSFVTILARQTGLAIPIAFGVSYLINKGVAAKNFATALFPIFLGAGIQFAYQEWLVSVNRLPENYGRQIKTLFDEFSKGLDNILYNFSSITLYSLIYLGLFTVPLLILVYNLNFREFSDRKRILIFLSSIILFISIMTTLILNNDLMPLLGNTLQNYGVGPILLKNNLKSDQNMHDIFWITLTVTGVVGAILLIQYLWFTISSIFDQLLKKNSRSENWLKMFILSTVIVYFFPLGFLGFSTYGFYDRYLIFLLPLVIMIILISTPKIDTLKVGHTALGVSLIVLLIYCVFTVVSTHDYLNLNRTRWKALNFLMKTEHIAPNKIDGGFEFNGWFLYDSNYHFGNDSNKSWYWVDKDDYVVTLNPIPGYRKIKSYPLRNWLPREDRNIIVLQKIPNDKPKEN